MKLSFLIALVLLSASPVGNEEVFRSQFVVWNVGQGQWATLVTQEFCFHLDAGGEFFPPQKLSHLCRHKKNLIYLSHWDLDHISFVGKMKRLFPNRCMAQAPLGKGSARKRTLLDGIAACDGSASQIHRIYSADDEKNSNGSSQVVSALGHFLAPGDSSSKQEKIWSEFLEKDIFVLLLGHHGSRTSTSEELLKHLPHLKLAIASARFRRYGHPHAETLARLRKYHIPVLRTEDWGHIRIDVGPLN